MTDSYRAELLEQVDRIFVTDMAGRATIGDVLDGVIADLPAGAADYYVRKGVHAVVQSYFRAKNTEGLPQAPQVNNRGEHVQYGLWTVEECQFLARRYMDRSQSNRGQAEKVAALCAETYGVVIDLDAISRDAAAS